MLKYIVALFIVIFLFALNACSTASKITSLKPEADDASPLVYETTPSFISLPINIKLKDIENQTNMNLNGLIFDDNNIEDDNIEMKIWKLAPISIENDKNNPGNKITTRLPLKASIKYRIGTKTLGVDLYNTKEFNLNGVVTLESDISLTNWKLSTKTNLKTLDWNESPTMLVFGKNIPITYLINPTIKLFKSKIETKIDEAIEKSMDFKPNVLSALEKICTPFKISETYECWLQIVPTEVYSSNAELKEDEIIMSMGMKCDMSTLIGKKPENKFDAKKISLKQLPSISNLINANFAAVSSFEEASIIMTKNFSGQEFGSEKKKIKVIKVNLWHKSSKLIIALDVLGTVNGTIYLSGVPQYNEQTKEIYFDQLDYVLDTKDKLMKTANWLAHGLILKKIKESCRYSIISNLEEGKKSMETYLKNYSPMPGVLINGKVQDFDFQKIKLTNKAIIAFIKINGTANVTVDGLK